MNVSKPAAVGDEAVVELVVVLAEPEGGDTGCFPGEHGLADDVMFEENTDFLAHHFSFDEVESAMSAGKGFSPFIEEWEEWAHFAGQNLFRIFGEGGTVVV